MPNSENRPPFTGSQGSDSLSVSKPVVFITFNRPDKAQKVFEQIALAKPKQLFFISDGPRPARAEEQFLVQRCRALVKRVDWDCTVFTKFSEVNLGCRRSVVSGLNWVFSHVDEAIILEDDCVPSEDFFKFCSELLDRFKDNHSVGSISGSNIDTARTAESIESYYFSRFPNVWGWATWKRSWDLYSDNLKNVNRKSIRKVVQELTSSKGEQRYWLTRFSLVKKNLIDTWDYQLVFHHWTNRMVSVIPSSNLVKNIGFGIDATHTKSVDSRFAGLETVDLKFPLTHSTQIGPEVKLDEASAGKRFSEGLLESLYQWLFALSPRSFRDPAIRFYFRMQSGNKK